MKLVLNYSLTFKIVVSISTLIDIVRDYHFGGTCCLHLKIEVTGAGMWLSNMRIVEGDSRMN
jgi:hypothetical protein